MCRDPPLTLIRFWCCVSLDQWKLPVDVLNPAAEALPAKLQLLQQLEAAVRWDSHITNHTTPANSGLLTHDLADLSGSVGGKIDSPTTTGSPANLARSKLSVSFATVGRRWNALTPRPVVVAGSDDDDDDDDDDY
jgi:hypothetical protein